jgi:hypothetical protein
MIVLRRWESSQDLSLSSVEVVSWNMDEGIFGSWSFNATRAHVLVAGIEKRESSAGDEDEKIGGEPRRGPAAL